MIEEQAMEDALGNLENKTQMLATLLDFDNRETKEAQFAHLIDKLDPTIQCKIYQDLGLQKPITLLQGSKCLKSPKIKITSHLEPKLYLIFGMKQKNITSKETEHFQSWNRY